MVKLTGERKAVSSALLALYGFLFLIVCMQPPPGWEKVFIGLTLIYWVGFFGVVAGYFWGRWYALGLGLSGLASAGISIFQMGPEPVLVFYGVTHGLISIALWGNQMAKTFDGKLEWRKRFHLDEQATDKLGKAITRLGMSLPYVIMYALAPKNGSALAGIAGFAGLGLAGLGFFGFLKHRTWSLAALVGGAVMTYGSVLVYSPTLTLSDANTLSSAGVLASGLLATSLLVAATQPYWKSVVRALKA